MEIKEVLLEPIQNITSTVTSNDAPVIAAVLTIIFAFFLIFILIAIGTYIYSSFAYMSIARKAKDPLPGLAWIPFVGKPLLASRISRMHWWPILLLLGYFLFWSSYVVFLGWAAFIVFTIFFYIWRWKMYGAVNHPGWFALFFLIFPVGHIFLGIVAWSKEDTIEQIKRKKK